jgi:hypothetical protein
MHAAAVTVLVLSLLAACEKKKTYSDAGTAVEQPRDAAAAKAPSSRHQPDANHPDAVPPPTLPSKRLIAADIMGQSRRSVRRHLGKPLESSTKEVHFYEPSGLEGVTVRYGGAGVPGNMVGGLTVNFSEGVPQRTVADWLGLPTAGEQCMHGRLLKVTMTSDTALLTLMGREGYCR